MKKILKVLILTILLSIFLSGNATESNKTNQKIIKTLEKMFKMDLSKILNSMGYYFYDYQDLKTLNKNIFILDINNDKKQDYIVYIDKIVFGVISKVNNYGLYKISNTSNPNIEMLKINTKYGKTIIETVNSKKNKFNYFFDNYGFIEFNPKPTKYNIEKIEFNSWSGFNGSFSITINSNKEIIYFERGYKNGIFYSSFKLEQSIFNKIIFLLDYVDFPNLENKYEYNQIIEGGGGLKITYNNGKVKEIIDDLFSGTQGLERIFNVLLELRKNENMSKFGGKIILKGVISGSKPIAIISIGNNSKNYYLGDRIVSILKLVRIDSNTKSIVFSINNKSLFKIELEDEN